VVGVLGLGVLGLGVLGLGVLGLANTLESSSPSWLASGEISNVSALVT
jgi:hypothetical protein